MSFCFTVSNLVLPRLVNLSVLVGFGLLFLLFVCFVGLLFCFIGFVVTSDETFESTNGSKSQGRYKDCHYRCDERSNNPKKKVLLENNSSPENSRFSQ